jgi:hypothetical protein
MKNLHEQIAKDAGIARCRVRCEVCHREQAVNGGQALRDGWPLCHGATMSLLPPHGMAPRS